MTSNHVAANLQKKMESWVKIESDGIVNVVSSFDTSIKSHKRITFDNYREEVKSHQVTARS